MITALLCGLMYGALAYRAWWIKPRTLKAEFEAWDGLSDEALVNFERKPDPVLHDSRTGSIFLPTAKDWRSANHPLPKATRVYREGME